MKLWPCGEETLQGFRVSVSDGGEVAWGEVAEGLGDGELAFAVIDGHHHSLLRYGYEAVRECHLFNA